MRLLRILIALGLVLSACTFASRNARVLEASLSEDEMTLWISVDTCNADLAVWVDETAESVVLDVVAENDTNDDCADGVTIHLDEPLADRSVIEAGTGDILLVRRGAE